MANFKTAFVNGTKPTPYCGSGEPRNIHIVYQHPTNLPIGDIVELVDLDDNTQLVDWTVFGVPPGSASSIGELNAGRTALSTTYKTAVSGVQRADSPAHLANTTGKRRVGIVLTTAQTGAGAFNVMLTVRAV
jgi:hypothetical protein